MAVKPDSRCDGLLHARCRCADVDLALTLLGVLDASLGRGRAGHRTGGDLSRPRGLGTAVGRHPPGHFGPRTGPGKQLVVCRSRRSDSSAARRGAPHGFDHRHLHDRRSVRRPAGELAARQSARKTALVDSSCTNTCSCSLPLVPDLASDMESAPRSPVSAIPLALAAGFGGAHGRFRCRGSVAA